jgi:hypothetical protein
MDSGSVFEHAAHVIEISFLVKWIYKIKLIWTPLKYYCSACKHSLAPIILALQEVPLEVLMWYCSET